MDLVSFHSKLIYYRGCPYAETHYSNSIECRYCCWALTLFWAWIFAFSSPKFQWPSAHSGLASADSSCKVHLALPSIAALTVEFSSVTALIAVGTCLDLTTSQPAYSLVLPSVAHYKLYAALSHASSSHLLYVFWVPNRFDRAASWYLYWVCRLSDPASRCDFHSALFPSPSSPLASWSLPSDCMEHIARTPYWCWEIRSAHSAASWVHDFPGSVRGSVSGSALTDLLRIASLGEQGFSKVRLKEAYLLHSSCELNEIRSANW